jgi:integrase/recombinase XerC
MIPAFEKHIHSFRDYLKFEKRYSAHTILAYIKDLDQFFSFAEKKMGATALVEITHTYVRSWLAEMKEEEGTSSRTITRKISSLKSFYKYLLKTGVVQQSPMTKVLSPKISKRLPDFVQAEDADKLMNAMDHSEDWSGLNTRLIVVLLYSTGMRLSEMVGLKHNQLDYSRSHVKVLGKGNKERIIPLSPEVLQLVRDYTAEKKKEFGEIGEYLLVTGKGKTIYPKYIYLLVKRFLGEEIKTLNKKSPHVLRHSFATHLANNGASLNAIKDLLGHSSLAATQVYTHNTIEKLKDVYKKAHPKA